MCGAWKASHSGAHKSQTFDFGSAAPNTMLATKPEAIHHDSHIDISRQAENHNELQPERQSLYPYLISQKVPTSSSSSSSSTGAVPTKGWGEEMRVSGLVFFQA